MDRGRLSGWRSLLHKPGDLSSFPGTHTEVEGENWLPRVVPWPPHDHTHHACMHTRARTHNIHAHTHTQLHKNLSKQKLGKACKIWKVKLAKMTIRCNHVNRDKHRTHILCSYPQTDHTLNPRTRLSRFKRTEITQSLYSAHSRI